VVPEKLKVIEKERRVMTGWVSSDPNKAFDLNANSIKYITVTGPFGVWGGWTSGDHTMARSSPKVDYYSKWYNTYRVKWIEYTFWVLSPGVPLKVWIWADRSSTSGTSKSL
jgi:hypothetical protein